MHLSQKKAAFHESWEHLPKCDWAICNIRYFIYMYHWCLILNLILSLISLCVYLNNSVSYCDSWIISNLTNYILYIKSYMSILLLGEEKFIVGVVHKCSWHIASSHRVFKMYETSELCLMLIVLKCILYPYRIYIWRNKGGRGSHTETMSSTKTQTDWEMSQKVYP